jgi:hypothetical protein
MVEFQPKGSTSGTMTAAERVDLINSLTDFQCRALLARISGYAPEMFDRLVADNIAAYGDRGQ